jgi:hypothetical protein
MKRRIWKNCYEAGARFSLSHRGKKKFVKIHDKNEILATKVIYSFMHANWL